MTRILGAVLAGGASRRFGQDKALALLGGRPLIAHALAALDAQVDAMVVCGRDWPGGIGLPDRPGPGLGPLGGLAAALHHAAGHGFDAVVSLPCDVARVPPDLVLRLGEAGAAYVEGQPVVGRWPAALSAVLDAHIARDPRRSLRGWVAVAGARPVTIELPNVNTPEDLARLTGEA
ncbi:molybdenum cofactor guanylyltransferase [Sphingomonas jatrophae]|uniref:Molybdenum cofactor guanylyltransferase n=1 Tax=Sphingomonas jatrophae TaxID=1166337 RepID=A0A1I6MA91_9SPHN|nr:NTP transferase domain-containing protein [Sphingomonas jatrophae]SFS12571.1 molybdenum cofactor guanylyltransferase [Sphingomonas jatrophae]